MRINLRRWGVFNLVGFGGFLIQVGTIALLTRTFGWSSLAATAIGLELAALHNFVGHSRWTWGDQPVATLRGWLGRYCRYQVAKTASLGASLAITMFLTTVTPLPIEVANTLAVLACALPNYFLTEQLVFTRRRPTASRSRY